MTGPVGLDRMTHARRAARRSLGWRPTVCLLVGCLLASCGDLTSGGFGEVEVLIAADSVLAASGHAPSVPPLPAGSGGGAITGTLTVHLQVDLRRGPDEWVELTDGVQEVTLALGSHDPVLLARREVPPGRYAASRTRFRLVRAEIQGGLTIEGEPYVGSVLVPLPAEGRALVRPLEFDVLQGEVRGLVLGLRADRWLLRVDPAQRTVARGDFEEVQELRPR